MSRDSEIPTAEQQNRFEKIADTLGSNFAEGLHGDVEFSLQSLQGIIDEVTGGTTTVTYAKQEDGVSVCTTVQKSAGPLEPEAAELKS
jgi:hypothetical protein